MRYKLLIVISLLSVCPFTAFADEGLDSPVTFVNNSNHANMSAFCQYGLSTTNPVNAAKGQSVAVNDYGKDYNGYTVSCKATYESLSDPFAASCDIVTVTLKPGAVTYSVNSNDTVQASGPGVASVVKVDNGLLNGDTCEGSILKK